MSRKMKAKNILLNELLEANLVCHLVFIVEGYLLLFNCLDYLVKFFLEADWLQNVMIIARGSFK